MKTTISSKYGWGAYYTPFYMQIIKKIIADITIFSTDMCNLFHGSIIQLKISATTKPCANYTIIHYYIKYKILSNNI